MPDEKSEVFNWNFAINLTPNGENRSTALGLSMISSQLDHIITLLKKKNDD